MSTYYYTKDIFPPKRGFCIYWAATKSWPMKQKLPPLHKIENELLMDRIEKTDERDRMLKTEAMDEDVFSTEEWATDMIPQPVAAVLMLYPLTPQQKEAASKQEDNIVACSDSDDDVWFIRQRIGNACGTIGLLHGLMNAPEPLNTFCEDSWLHSFQQNCPRSMPPDQKADLLEADTKVAQLHDKATSSRDNQTSRGNLEDRVDTHFIALVCHKNKLYELDGRKTGPVDHGPTTQSTLLRDACQVVKQFMSRDPNELRFTILALAPSST